MPKHIKFQLSNEIDYLFSRYIEYNKISEQKKIEIYFLDQEQRKTSKSIKNLDVNYLKKIL